MQAIFLLYMLQPVVLFKISKQIKCKQIVIFHGFIFVYTRRNEIKKQFKSKNKYLLPGNVNLELNAIDRLHKCKLL